MVLLFLIAGLSSYALALNGNNRVSAQQLPREYGTSRSEAKISSYAVTVREESVLKTKVEVTKQKPKSKQKVKNTSRAPSQTAGNTYARGNCTWYAKSKRPDLPNSLGNANTWASRAKASGIPTGPTPKVGSIGQKGMHVVYVERVNSDGTIYISEMNYTGLGKISHRTVSPAGFKFIY